MSNARVTAHNSSSDLSASVSSPTCAMQLQHSEPPANPQSPPTDRLSVIAFGHVPSVYQEYIRERERDRTTGTDAGSSRPMSLISPPPSSPTSSSSSNCAVQSASALPAAPPQLPSGPSSLPAPNRPEESISANARLMQLAESKSGSGRVRKSSKPSLDANARPPQPVLTGQASLESSTSSSKRQTLGYSPRQSSLDGPASHMAQKPRTAETLVRRSDGRPKEKDEKKEKDRRSIFSSIFFPKKEHKHNNVSKADKLHSSAPLASAASSPAPPAATSSSTSAHRSLTPTGGVSAAHIREAESSANALLRKSSIHKSSTTANFSSAQLRESSLEEEPEGPPSLPDSDRERSSSTSPFLSLPASALAPLAPAPAPAPPPRRAGACEAEPQVVMRSKRAPEAVGKSRSAKKNGGNGDGDGNQSQSQSQSAFRRSSRFSFVTSSFTNLTRLNFLRRSSMDMTGLASKSKDGKLGKSKLALPASSSVVDVLRAPQQRQRHSVVCGPSGSGATGAAPRITNRAGDGDRQEHVPASALSDAESESERVQELEADLDDLEIGGAVRGLQRPVQRGEKVEKEDGDEVDSDNVATLKPGDVRAFREASRAQHESERALQQATASARYTPTTTVIPLPVHIAGIGMSCSSTCTSATATATAPTIVASGPANACIATALEPNTTQTLTPTPTLIAPNPFTSTSAQSLYSDNIIRNSTSSSSSTSTCNASTSPHVQLTSSRLPASASASERLLEAFSETCHSAQATASSVTNSKSNASTTDSLSRPLPPALPSRSPLAASAITSRLAGARGPFPEATQSSTRIALLASSRPDDSFPPMNSRVPRQPPRRSCPNASPSLDALHSQVQQLRGGASAQRRSLMPTSSASASTPAPPPPTPAHTMERELRMQGFSRSPHGRPEGAIEALTRLSQARSGHGFLVDQRRTSVCVFSHPGAEDSEDAIRLSRFASGRVTQDDIASDTLKRQHVNRGSDANTREEDFRRFSSYLPASLAAGAPDEMSDGERHMDPDATLKLKRPSVPTVLRFATINGGTQLRHCTQLHECDADDNEVLDSSTRPTSVSPEEVNAAGVSRRCAPASHAHSLRPGVGVHFSTSEAADVSAVMRLRGCRSRCRCRAQVQTPDEGRGESCDECSCAVAGAACGELSTRSLLELCSDRMTELDARLHHKLQEREQLVHHLLLKLQRSSSQQIASPSASASAASPAASGTGQQPPQQLIGSSRLVEAVAELAAVSKKFAALKTSAVDTRKSLRVLFSGSCAAALQQPRNRTSIGYSSSNSSSASSGAGVGDVPDQLSSSSDRAPAGSLNVPFGGVRVSAALLQQALDALTLSSELLDFCSAARGRQRVASKMDECSSCHLETLPPEEQTILVLNTPAILIDTQQ